MKRMTRATRKRFFLEGGGRERERERERVVAMAVIFILFVLIFYSNATAKMVDWCDFCLVCPLLFRA